MREWNNQQSRKLLLSFIKPICSTPFFIHHPVGVKLLVRLRVGFSHLRGHKFRQNFHYTLNSLCSCSFEPETTLHYFRKRNFLILILEKFIYFLIFAEAEFSSSNIFKKNSYIVSKESISYISQNGTLHFSAQALKIKKLYLRKIYYASGNENPEEFLYLISFVRIFFIKIFFCLNFFQNFFIRIFS